MLHGIEGIVAKAEQHTYPLMERLSGAGFQTMLAVHAALVLSACWFAFSRTRLGISVATVCTGTFGLTWLAVDQPWEGRTLWQLSATHGVTQADMLVPVAFCVALAARALRTAVEAAFGRCQKAPNRLDLS